MNESSMNELGMSDSDPSLHSTPADSTEADRDEQLTAEFRPLNCRQCGAGVRVRKRSIYQTSVQWDQENTGRCPYLARASPSAPPVEGCPALSESIQDAVQAGSIPAGSQ
jgi:hypothetical protein